MKLSRTMVSIVMLVGVTVLFTACRYGMRQAMEANIPRTTSLRSLSLIQVVYNIDSPQNQPVVLSWLTNRFRLF